MRRVFPLFFGQKSHVLLPHRRPGAFPPTSNFLVIILLTLGNLVQPDLRQQVLE